MSEIEQMKALVKERLTAAVEDVFGMIENVVQVYEDKDSRSKWEIERQNNLLDIRLKPKIQLPRSDPPQLSVCKEEVPPEQQERSPSLGQEDPEPPQIKEEQEETWTSQEGEQLQCLEEADAKDSVFTITSVRSLHDQQQSQSPHLNQTVENREGEPLPSTSTEQMETEADGEDCGVSEPTSDCQPLSSDRYVAESEDTDRDEDRTESGGPQSGLKTNTSQTVKRQSSAFSSKGKKSMESSHLKSASQDAATCNVCGKSFTYYASLMKHVRTHITDTPCVCGVCGKPVESTGSLVNHLKSHTLHSCSVRHKELGSISKRADHMRIHTVEKSHSCSVCGKEFNQAGHLKTHMRIHTGERPYNCSVCGKGYIQAGNLKTHMRIHTGEKLHCSICGKGFYHTGNRKAHMKTHTGEKSHSCSVCGKRFSQAGYLKIHARIHTGEKPYTCSFCGKEFYHPGNLKTHMKIHRRQ